MDFSDEVPGFVIESNENLALLDLELVKLEKSPEDDALIASVFRTIHTIKGTSGFFGFTILGSITHFAENLLGQVREKERRLTPELVSLVLETVDAVRRVLKIIESTGKEGSDEFMELRARLELAFVTRDPSTVVAETPAKAGVDDASPIGSRVDAGFVLEKSPLPTERRRRDADGDDRAEPQQYNRRADDGLVNSTIRVDVKMLDKLMNLVGELVLARNQILQNSTSPAGSHASAQRLNLITSELQEGVMRARMQPIGVVWNKLPRVVRDLASDLGKTIDLQMEGSDTELDKTIIEAIKDPLTHIVRNSCDHGIEQPEIRLAKGKSAGGRILLRAFHEGGHVNIEIADDGAGLDPDRLRDKAVHKGLLRAEQAAQMSDWEALRLIFLPGFSTAEKITGISGRGVGMDVVKTNIEKISGSLDMSNRPGEGMTIKIKIPLTLAIIPGLVVTVKGRTIDGTKSLDQRFVIPQANLLELVRLEGEKIASQIERIHDAEVFRRRGKLLPLASLSGILGIASAQRDGEVMNIVVLKAEDTAFGLIVDEVNDTQEIVVKALGKQLKTLNCYVGATIMGDGKIALILDVVGIARLGRMLAPTLERSRTQAAPQPSTLEARQTLLFRAGRFPCLMLDLSLVARLEEVANHRVEHAAGEPVIRYRDTLLPLVSLKTLLDPDAVDKESSSESFQVIVVGDGDRQVGLIVDQILDIVDEPVTHRQPLARFGLLGSGIIGGRVADFVDVEAILSAARDRTGASTAFAPYSSRRILLVDPSSPSRGALRSYLEMHGHQVMDRASLEGASESVAIGSIDLVVTTVASDKARASSLMEEMRGKPKRASIPVISLSDDKREGELGISFDRRGPRDEREALLRSIQAVAKCDLETELELVGSYR